MKIDTQANGFEAMRAGLVARGLLARQVRDGAESYRLTPAGEVHVETLIAQLRGAGPPATPRQPAVTWRTGR